MHLERFQNQKFSYPGEEVFPSPGPYPPPQPRPIGKKYKKGGCGENNKMGEQG